MRALRIRLSVMLPLVAASSCAHSLADVAPAPSQTTLVPTDRALLTRAEIERTGARTALDAVRTRRPEMLRYRGPNMPARPAAEPAVYVDGMRESGGLAALSNLPSSVVWEIRFFNAQDATIRYGAGHGSGAVLVSTLSARARE